ncbi:MAG: intermembrane transport protein PqiB [Deltaproteobacteria bacterium]|nr:intermembrane transport protein PqiB [Deltaproteobacteria bacterium]MBW2447236.1 intermembrane transport protein PqiB [Deltaproteobacteria bacterium]
MADASANVSERQRMSTIWLVPIVAVVLGAWMVIHTLRSQGPEVEIVFASGSGIEAEKTKIKYRDVEVGVVESVGLDEDLESVVVTARLDKEATSLLHEDTEFWVVQPRIGPAGISGLGTLLSGGFIQIAPGTGAPGRREFRGLDVPPVTPAGTPGLKLELVSDRAGSVGAGDPVLYKKYRVGRIETAEFDLAERKMRYGVFIEAPYDSLVTSSTRFWNVSGFSLSATADGIQMQMDSLQSLLVGGVVFGLPEGGKPGEKAEAGEQFQLYENYSAVNERPYRESVEYVVPFTQSLRGLRPGAPVEYRGIRIGSVERVLLSELNRTGLSGKGAPIPVLIRLEPGRLELPDDEQGVAMLKAAVERAVGNGLRATLSTGSLLTGSLYVYMDVYPNEKPARLGEFDGRPTIPTIESGLGGIQVRVTSLLDKLNALPVEDLLDKADQILADVDALVASPSAQELPASLDATLVELRSVLDSVSGDSAMQGRLLRTMTELDRTLAALRQLLRTLDDQPNSVIFSREPAADPIPPAGTP